MSRWTPGALTHSVGFAAILITDEESFAATDGIKGWVKAGKQVQQI